MAKEIEHKYLVIDKSFKPLATSVRQIIQGYLSSRKESTVRVRIADNKAYLTVKGATCGAMRDEWEYEIPVDDATQMLSYCEDGYIDKSRYIVPFGGFIWEVDCFHGRLEGLMIAEIELATADTAYALPPFVGADVTGDVRYYNSNLLKALQPPSAD